MYRCLSIICVSLCTLGPGENFGSPATGLIDGYKPPCGFWESNPRFPEEQAVLLTVEAFLQSQNKSFYNYMVYWEFLGHLKRKGTEFYSVEYYIVGLCWIFAELVNE